MEQAQQVRVGVAALVWDDGQILMGKRKGSHAAGTWSLPGGHMEYGETPEQTAERETLEETGLVVRATARKGYTNTIFADCGKHYITLYIECEVVSGEPVLLEPHKCEGWVLFAPDCLPFPLMECIPDGMLTR